MFLPILSIPNAKHIVFVHFNVKFVRYITPSKRYSGSKQYYNYYRAVEEALQ